MNIETELNNYIQNFSEDQKQLLLQLIKKIAEDKNGVSAWQNIIEYNEELEAAVEKIKNGDFISHEEVEKESEQW